MPQKLPILLLGVGNLLFRDEGIGVAAAQYITEKIILPEGVELLEGGTLGMRLMADLISHRKVVVMDAVLGGGRPGTLYRLTGEDMRKSLSFRDSLHQTDLPDTLMLCELAGYKPETVVIGMEPEDYQSMRIGLSPTCMAALPDMVARALLETGTPLQVS